jgi:WD40 repeat protein
VTDVCFSSKSAQLCFGCDDGSMGILNIRQKAVEVEKRDHDPNYSTRSVSFNCYDNLVCSGCSDGEIIVYQLGEEPGAKIIFRDKSMKSALTMARFSHTKRHIMASSYESGAVCIWDLQAATQGSQQSALRHKFFSHTNACSGLAFSPVNNLLICSAGLDSKILFYDIVDGKEVKKIDTGVPLSAISFCADGHTIAVGTNQGGRVIIYDLKEAKKVKIELKGHDVSKRISALQFSKIVKPAAA